MTRRLGWADVGVVTAACAVSLLATVPRLTSRPIWTDEALTVGATGELVDTLRATGGTMALYYAMVAPIAELSTDRVWLRLPSALLAAGTVAITYLIARRLLGRWGAASAALALASSWALARWGIEARGYALAMFLVATSWLGLVEAVHADDDRRRRRWWVLFAVAALLAPLAHGMAALQVLVQAGVLLARADRTRWLRPLVPVMVLWGVLLVGLFALGAGDVASWIEPLTWSDLKQVHAMLVGRGWAGLLVTVPVLAGAVVAVRSVLARPPWSPSASPTADTEPADAGEPAGGDGASVVGGWPALVTASWALGVPLLVLAISVVRPYQEPRYLITSLPGVAILIGLAISQVRPPRLRAASLAAVVVALLSMQPAVTDTAGEDWPGIVEMLAESSRPGDVVVMRPLLRAPFDYALDESGREVAVAPLSPPERFAATRRLYAEPDASVRSLILESDAPTVWLVVRGTEAKDEAEALRDDPEFAAERSVAVVAKRRGELALYRFRLTDEG